MKADLSFGLKFEMLHHIRDIDAGSVQSHLVQRPIEKLSRGSHKRTSFAILLVPGLLAQNDDPGILWTFAEHRLRGIPVQVTALTALGGSLQASQIVRFGGYKRCCGPWSFHLFILTLHRCAL